MVIKPGTRGVAWRRWLQYAAIGAALAPLCAGTPAAAGPESTAARAVLETHCARCHDAPKLENPPAKGGLGNILDLDRLRTREDLVVPGDPDASRLYQIMLSHHRPHSVFFGPVPGPTPAEIGSVRDWLATLPPVDPGCGGRPPVTTAGISRDIAAWKKAFETDAAKPLRFISLANLHNICRTDAELAAYRGAVATLLTRLTLRPVTSLDTVGEASAVLTFRPSDLGMTAEAWDLRAGRGESLAEVVSAESLAARALSAGVESGRIVPSANVAEQITGSLDGLNPVEALAHEFTRTVTSARATAELQTTSAGLRDDAARLKGEDRDRATRLLQSGLPRAEWELLKAVIARRPVPRTLAQVGSDQNARQLTLALWTDALAYKAGDLLTIHARPSGDCNLTVVAIESSGLATVLFPNDSTTDNRVPGGTAVQIPPTAAPFQIRLDKPGRHGIVAICNATAKRPQGIGHDFERQRFTVLGDWRTFLLQTNEREVAYQKTQDDLRKFRTGAGPAAALENQLPLGTEDEARAGITLDISP